MIGAREGIRDLAAVIVADLRDTPRGITRLSLIKMNHSIPSDVAQAIEWAKARGLDIRYDADDDCYVLHGDVRHLPAAALSRADLFDGLRAALGQTWSDDADPLEIVRGLVERATATGWREVSRRPSRLERVVGQVKWTITEIGDTATLTARAKGDEASILVGELVDDDPRRQHALLAWADYQSARAGEHFEPGDPSW